MNAENERKTTAERARAITKAEDVDAMRNLVPAEPGVPRVDNRLAR